MMLKVQSFFPYRITKRTVLGYYSIPLHNAQIPKDEKWRKGCLRKINLKSFRNILNLE